MCVPFMGSWAIPRSSSSLPGPSSKSRALSGKWWAWKIIHGLYLFCIKFPPWSQQQESKALSVKGWARNIIKGLYLNCIKFSLWSLQQELVLELYPLVPTVIAGHCQASGGHEILFMDYMCIVSNSRLVPTARAGHCQGSGGHEILFMDYTCIV